MKVSNANRRRVKNVRKEKKKGKKLKKERSRVHKVFDDEKEKI